MLEKIVRALLDQGKSEAEIEKLLSYDVEQEPMINLTLSNVQDKAKELEKMISTKDPLIQSTWKSLKESMDHLSILMGEANKEF